MRYVYVVQRGKFLAGTVPVKWVADRRRARRYRFSNDLAGRHVARFFAEMVGGEVL